MSSRRENRENVRRRLFPPEEGALALTGPLAGEADNAHNRFLEQLLNADRAAAVQRWNFDFERERPLDGKWQWERISDGGPAGEDEQR